MIRTLQVEDSRPVCVSCLLSCWDSIYWDYALTVPLRQIVCLHCHQSRESPFPPPPPAATPPLCLNGSRHVVNCLEKMKMDCYFVVFFFQLTAVVRWFWSVRMGFSGPPSTSLLGVTSWPSSPAWKQGFYPGVSWSLPSGPRRERCVCSVLYGSWAC